MEDIIVTVTVGNFTGTQYLPGLTADRHDRVMDIVSAATLAAARAVRHTCAQPLTPEPADPAEPIRPGEHPVSKGAYTRGALQLTDSPTLPGGTS